LRAAGGAILAVDEVMSGKAKTRSSRSARPVTTQKPPLLWGFVFSTMQPIAARYAQRRYGAERVAIVDFDAHHGKALSKSSGATGR